MAQCAFKLNNAISDLKVEEGSFKVNNDECGTRVARLKTTLKITQAEVGQVDSIDAEIGAPEAVKEPSSNPPSPCANASSTDQALYSLSFRFSS